jgi:formylglycine-generating enzyme required for sulfatase activity
MKMALDAWQEIPGNLIHTIPVRLDECELPEPFGRYHRADLFDPRGFDRLVRGLYFGLEQRGTPRLTPLESPTIETEPPSDNPPPPATESQRVTSPTHPADTPAIIEPSSLPPIDSVPDFSIQTNSIGMEFVKISAGTFLMGTPNEQLDTISGGDKTYREWIENETPQHRVTINKPFYLGKYEVTQAQWQAVMGTTIQDQQKKALYDRGRIGVGDNYPMYYVSWYDAQQFIQKLNEGEGVTYYRLPTEAEWEYAARAGTTTIYSFGDDASQLGNYAWYRDNSGDTTHPVGQKKPNDWGLYDMHGNVWELVQERYAEDYYQNSPSDDPQGPDDGAYRVVRGGGWYRSARHARSAYRSWNPPGGRYGNLGFRCLSSAPSR